MASAAGEGIFMPREQEEKQRKNVGRDTDIKKVKPAMHGPLAQ